MRWTGVDSFPGAGTTGSRLPNKKVTELKRGVKNNYRLRSNASTNDDDSSLSESDMDNCSETARRGNKHGKSTKVSLMSKSAVGSLPYTETKKVGVYCVMTTPDCGHFLPSEDPGPHGV